MSEYFKTAESNLIKIWDNRLDYEDLEYGDFAPTEDIIGKAYYFLLDNLTETNQPIRLFVAPDGNILIYYNGDCIKRIR